MRLPFVSRQTFDLIVEEYASLLRIERARTSDLMGVIIDMKVNGGIVPRPLGTLALRPVDRCVQAIDRNKHSARPQFRARLMDYLEGERQKGTAEAVIEEKLNNWSKVPNEGDSVAADEDDDTITITTRSK